MFSRVNPRGGPAMLGLACALAVLAGATLTMEFAVLPGRRWFASALCVGGLGWCLGRSGLRVLGAVLVGLGLAGLHGHHALAQRIDPSLVGVDLDVELRIVGLVRESSGDAGSAGRGYTGFDARLVSVPAAPELAGRRVALGWYGDPPRLAPGQAWALQVRLKRPRGVLNPAGFDRERRALEQRLAATGYVRDAASARLLGEVRSLDAWRSRTSDRLRARVPHPGLRYALGLSLGDTRHLQPQDWDALRATGLTHLLAISGFHVGVMAGMGAMLAGAAIRLWPAAMRRVPRPMVMAWTALACALGYAAAAGFSLPIQRAVLMIAAALLAKLSRRPVVASHSFALAMVIIVAFDPLAVLSPGFWLSFLGVGWLLWCLSGDRAGGYLSALLTSQLVATLGLLPLTVWFFGEASLIGPLANLAGIPLVTLVVVPLSLLGTLFELTWPGGGRLVLLAAALLSEYGSQGMHAMAAWPAAVHHFPTPGLAAFLLAFAGAAWLLMPRGVVGKPLALLLLLPLLWPWRQPLAEGEFEVHLIDVGQGLSVLVRTRTHAVLYDTGPQAPGGLDRGATAVVPTLRGVGVAHLDAIVVSHGDSDHAGGLGSVLRAYGDPPVSGPQPWLERWLRTTARVDTMAARSCLAGEGWRWDGVDFVFLHPTPHFPDLGNEGSCVLRVGGEGGSLLLTGDIGHVVERRLGRLHPELLDVDILVLGHHGSRGSSSADFIDAVSPRLALNAAAHASRFNHPHPEVVARLDARGIPLADSGEQGYVRVRVLRDGRLHTLRQREARRRFWHEPAGRFE